MATLQSFVAGKMQALRIFQGFSPAQLPKALPMTLDFTAAGAWLGAAAVGTFAVVLWARPSSDAPSAPSAGLVVGPASAGVWGKF